MTHKLWVFLLYCFSHVINWLLGKLAVFKCCVEVVSTLMVVLLPLDAWFKTQARCRCALRDVICLFRTIRRYHLVVQSLFRS